MVATDVFGKKKKAKVGKRAPVKSQTTDVKFRSSKIYVATQDTAVAAVTTTDRGHTVEQLLLQLQHPAVPVRLSALKGFQNIKLNNLQSHWHAIVPRVGNALLDADAAVRELALQNLHTVSLASYQDYMGKLLVSVLNSLDWEVAYFGAHVLCSLSSAVAWELPLVASLLRLLGDPTRKRVVRKQQKSNPRWTAVQAVKTIVLRRHKSGSKADRHVTTGRRSVDRSLLRLTSIQDIQRTSEAPAVLPDQVVKDLLIKLRDVCVETVTAHPPVFRDSCGAIQGLLDLSPNPVSLKVCKSIANQILESRALDNTQCRLLLRLARAVHFSEPQWIAVCAQYVESELGHDEPTENASRPTRFHATEALLVLLRTLLLDCHEHVKTETVHSLVELFCTVFFFDSVPTTLATSLVGQAAVQLGCDLWADVSYSLSRCKFKYGSPVSDVLYNLMPYISAWETTQVDLTDKCLMSVLNVMRTIPLVDAKPEDALLVAHWRKEMGSLFAFSSGTSLFERFPRDLQQKTLALMCMMASPTPQVVHDISVACARTRDGRRPHLSEEMASYALFCLHGIRRTVPMQTYLSAVIDSTGLMMLANEDDVVAAAVSSVEARVRNAAQCLVDCGTRKVLPKLDALLQSLLTIDEKPVSFVRARSGLVLLSVFAQDLRNDSVYDYVSPSTKELVDTSTRALLDGSFEVESSVFAAWINPVVESTGMVVDLVTVLDQFRARYATLELAQKQRALDYWSAVLLDRRIVHRADASTLQDGLQGLEDTTGNVVVNWGGLRVDMEVLRSTGRGR